MIISRRRSPSCIVGVLALIAFGMQLVPAAAQVSSSAELDILRDLPPDQRNAIIDRVLGRSSSSVLTTPTTVLGLPQTQLPPNALLRNPTELEDTDNGVPVLEAGDTILIEVDFDLPDVPAASTMTPQAPIPPSGVPSAEGAQAAQVAPQPGAQVSMPVDPTNLDPEELQRLERTIQQIRAKNPYQLSSEGLLYLPGFSAIAIAGLTEAKAALRLHSEPALNKLDLRVTNLPLKGSGAKALEPFGYDLFAQGMPSMMTDITVPVPGSYIVGPSDSLEIQLYGNEDRGFTLEVGRDGAIDFPELGPISVGGQAFESVKRMIEERVQRQMVGTQASVSMGLVRGIQVFVLGEAKYPGTYTVSGLSTITAALYAAGGVTRVGSLRNIQLKRRGVVVGRLDLYAMLLEGDTSNDLKLLPGDAVFIPPVGTTVSADGEVRRPAIYELQGEATVMDLVKLAGGLTVEADRTKGVLTRIGEDGNRVVIDATLDENASPRLQNGDILRVSRLRPTLHSAVMIEGHVYTAGPVPWRDGLRLSHVIRSLDDLQPNADVHYVLIRREFVADRRIAVLSADLAAALNSPASASDPQLMPRDRIIVFDKEAGRERVIGPLLDELRLQGNLNQPTEVVRIGGGAKAPGDYPLEPGMRVGDLVRAGGSLQDAAFGAEAELIRYEVKGGDKRVTELIKIDLAAAMRGDPGANLPLRPFDSLTIKGMPEWTERQTIELVGEVRFPGRYEIRRGETLKSVLMRAGGLTPYAFPVGSVFTREELRLREQEQLDSLATRLQGDLSTLALQAVAANQSQAGAALSVGQSLLTQLRSAKAVGRLVIDVEHVMKLAEGSSADIILHGGDRLIVPKLRQEIMVLGEVQNATSHLHQPGLTRDDYILLSGGLTRKADRDRVYVVRANGSVVASSGRWFASGDRGGMQPGDAVVVPLDTERLPTLPFWQAVTQILYNVAISVAAVNSF
jgi:polysaccharide export outer membrane protein